MHIIHRLHFAALLLRLSPAVLHAREAVAGRDARRVGIASPIAADGWRRSRHASRSRAGRKKEMIICVLCFGQRFTLGTLGTLERLPKVLLKKTSGKERHHSDWPLTAATCQSDYLASSGTLKLAFGRVANGMCEFGRSLQNAHEIRSDGKRVSGGEGRPS